MLIKISIREHHNLSIHQYMLSRQILLRRIIHLCKGGIRHHIILLVGRGGHMGKAFQCAHRPSAERTLHHHIHPIAPPLIHRTHRLIFAIRHKMTPCKHLLLHHIRQTEQHSIIPHKIEQRIRLLRIGSAHHLPPAHQMLCEQRQILPHIPIALIRIPRIADHRGAPLHIHHPIPHAQRRHIAAAVVFLILRCHIRWLYRLSARDRPRIPIRKHHQIIANIQMIDLKRLTRQEIHRHRRIIRHRALLLGHREILIIPAPRHPEPLRIPFAPAETQPILKERRTARIAIRAAPRRPIPIRRRLHPTEHLIHARRGVLRIRYPRDRHNALMPIRIRRQIRIAAPARHPCTDPEQRIRIHIPRLRRIIILRRRIRAQIHPREPIIRRELHHHLPRPRPMRRHLPRLSDRHSSRIERLIIQMEHPPRTVREGHLHLRSPLDTIHPQHKHTQIMPLLPHLGRKLHLPLERIGRLLRPYILPCIPLLVE